MKYVKKKIPIEISEPWQKLGDHPDVFDFMSNLAAGQGGKICKECKRRLDEHGQIKTLEGYHIVCPGDRIVTGVLGEKYPIKPDAFEKTYEPWDGK